MREDGKIIKFYVLLFGDENDVKLFQPPVNVTYQRVETKNCNPHHLFQPYSCVLFFLIYVFAFTTSPFRARFIAPNVK